MYSFDLLMIFFVLFLCFVAFIANLTIKGNKDAIAYQYQSLLNKYHAKAAQYFCYEKGIAEIPENTIAVVFADELSLGIQLINNEFDQIFRLDFSKINWICAITPDETIDIDLELPQTSKFRMIVSYVDTLSNKNKYIVFNYDISESKHATEMNRYIVNEFIGTSKSLSSYIVHYARIPDCPHNLVHSIHQTNENVVNL